MGNKTVQRRIYAPVHSYREHGQPFTATEQSFARLKTPLKPNYPVTLITVPRKRSIPAFFLVKFSAGLRAGH